MIEFKNVSLIYPNSEQTVVENLSFRLHDGEFVLVIGQTGIGKSSILRLMNGLVPHHTGGILSGEIEVGGRSTRLLRPGELSDLVGVVPQNPSNGFVCEIVEDEIAFSMETLGVPVEVMRKRVEEVLDLLALAPLRSRDIKTLSGGEQQRVAIAAALVTQPKVLLLDEPTSALDPVAAEEVLSILQRLVSDLGLTVIIAEHRLERVIQFVDRILLINNSQDVKLGETREVLKSSPIAPPLVELARVTGLEELPLTVREFRRTAIEIPTASKFEPQSLGEKLIEIQDLHCAYRDSNSKFSLQNINLEVRAGEVVALMGRNGAGKSTLLKSLVGLSPLVSGSVKVLGEDPRRFSSKELVRAIGYVPQEPSDLLIESTIAQECQQADIDNECEAGLTWKLFTNLIGEVSSSIHPRDLSEGQKLALALSVLLSGGPRVVVLDEPTRGFDYAAKRKLVSNLKAIASQNRAILLATHDVELVAELADRVLFVADGELISDTDVSEALTASPAFSPQVAKALPNKGVLTVNDVRKILGQP